MPLNFNIPSSTDVGSPGLQLQVQLTAAEASEDQVDLQLQVQHPNLAGAGVWTSPRTIRIPYSGDGTIDVTDGDEYKLQFFLQPQRLGAIN